MATHSNILAWEIPWREEPGELYPWHRKESDTTACLAHTHKRKLLLELARNVCDISVTYRVLFSFLQVIMFNRTIIS